MVWTNLGKEKMFEEFFCSGAIDNTFRLVLCTSAGDWDASTSHTSSLSVVSSLPEAGATYAKGGTSGVLVLRDAVGDGLNFDVSGADDLNTASSVRAVLQTAGDSFQYSGAFTGARYVAMVAAGSLGDAFTFNTAGNNVYAWWDINTETNISEGNTLTITSLSLQGQ
tara:strand:+ start:2573 stop:3073 length:501 start_codon:yes stop_codon:yes gene_type:complete